MNKFLEEKEKLLNNIENNTPNHWKEYYKNVPLDCIFDNLVIDINEIKRLVKENQKYKEVIDKAKYWVEDYMDEWDRNDDVWQELNELLILLEEVE